jgi:hypothetical protein
MVNNDFNTLRDFLGLFAPEVSGRKIAQPDGEDAAMLQRFAHGKCDRDERKLACELLRLHPAWLRWVAEQVRMSRGHAEVKE